MKQDKDHSKILDDLHYLFIFNREFTSLPLLILITIHEHLSPPIRDFTNHVPPILQSDLGLVSKAMVFWLLI